MLACHARGVQCWPAFTAHVQLLAGGLIAWLPADLAHAYLPTWLMPTCLAGSSGGCGDYRSEYLSQLAGWQRVSEYLS